ncbi:hypothetical protein LguiA_000548 [Lonicera macranthoides]
MGNKLDSLLGRNLKLSKFKSTINLATSRLTILKNQRQSRLSIACSDVVQLLNLGQHERALLRVEQVIKEQNMLDAFAMIQGYCDLLIERANLLEHAKVCPDELKEAISSLLFASTRCGEFPELQVIRSIFTSRFGKEFAGRSIELRNNCGVNPRIIQKLSTKQPSLEIRLKALEEIASENQIALQIEGVSSITAEEKIDMDIKQNRPRPDAPMNPEGAEIRDNLQILSEDMEKVENFADSMTGRRKYKDAADAAQAAFESAAYAAAAARAAVELSRSDPDDQNSPNSRPRKDNSARISGLGSNEKIHPIQNSESEDEEIYVENKNAGEFKRSMSYSSSDSVDNMLKETGFNSLMEDQSKALGKEIVIDESDDEGGIEQGWRSPVTNKGVGFDNDKSHFAGGSRMEDGPRLNLENRPISARTRRASSR